MAITEERVRNALFRKTVGVQPSGGQVGKSMEEILGKETNKYKQETELIKNYKIKKQEIKDEINKLTRQLERAEAHILKLSNRRQTRNNNGNNNQGRTNNGRNNVNWNDITCCTCGKRGHTARICSQGQNNQRKYRNQGNFRNKQMNYLEEEEDDDEEIYQMNQVNNDYI